MNTVSTLSNPFWPKPQTSSHTSAIGLLKFYFQMYANMERTLAKQPCTSPLVYMTLEPSHTAIARLQLNMGFFSTAAGVKKAKPPSAGAPPIHSGESGACRSTINAPPIKQADAIFHMPALQLQQEASSWTWGECSWTLPSDSRAICLCSQQHARDQLLWDRQPGQPGPAPQGCIMVRLAVSETPQFMLQKRPRTFLQTMKTAVFSEKTG